MDKQDGYFLIFFLILETELNFGRTEAATRASIKRVLNMATGSSNGAMEPPILVIL